MRRQLFTFLVVGTLSSTIGIREPSIAQEAATKVDAAAKADVAPAEIEVLTRGPIHEAFAAQFQTNAVAGVTIDKEPPAPVEEIPPAVKPDGENVQFIPGYWSWDAEATDFLWVSGTWRNAPPDRRWVPGYWNRIDTGFQWMCGFWADASVNTVAYHGAPPASLERGPNSNAPGDGYFWVPGCYVPRDDRYVWQPGYWCPHQANYVWIPSYNIQTAGGYIYIPGYWDFRLEQRGVIFAPVRVNLAAHAVNRIRLTPSVVIPTTVLQFHLFAPVNSNIYLFGNYYDARYAGIGIRPWYTVQYVKGVSDPLFGYYNWLYSRSGANYYLNVLTKWNAFYVNNVALRPALTLAGQTELALQQKASANLANSLIGVPLNDVVVKTPNAFVNLSAKQTADIATATNGLRVLSTDRIKVESATSNGLKVGGVGTGVSSAARVNTQPLRLPAMTAPVPQVRAAVPAHPSQLVRQTPSVVPNVGGNNVRGNVGGNVRGNLGGGLGGGGNVAPPVSVPGLKF